MALATALTFTIFSEHSAAKSPQLAGVRDAALKNPPWILISGIAAAPALMLTWWWRTVHKDEEIALGKRTERNTRFSGAVELLAGEKLEARLGGIYSLEALAGDSREEVGRVVETICAFLRSNGTIPSKDATEMPSQGAVIVQPPFLTQAAFSSVGRIVGSGTHVDLRRASLTGVEGVELNFSHGNMQNVDLRSARLRSLVLEHADLTGADLSSADLTGLLARNARFSNARLTDGILVSARLNDADLRLANLDRSNLRDAYLENADLAGATLAGADLSGARLIGANLQDANFQGANLSDADFTGAKVAGATFDHANILGANLSRVVRTRSKRLQS